MHFFFCTRLRNGEGPMLHYWIIYLIYFSNLRVVTLPDTSLLSDVELLLLA